MNDLTFQVQTAAGGCGEAAQVGRGKPGGQNDITALFQGLAQPEFQRADLVASHSQAHYILPFDPKGGMADGITKMGGFFQKCGLC